MSFFLKEEYFELYQIQQLEQNGYGLYLKIFCCILCCYETTYLALCFKKCPIFRSWNYLYPPGEMREYNRRGSYDHLKYHNIFLFWQFQFDFHIIFIIVYEVWMYVDIWIRNILKKSFPKKFLSGLKFEPGWDGNQIRKFKITL